MDVGVPSTQAYKAYKQGTQLVSKGHSAHLPKLPYFSGCMIMQLPISMI